MVHKYVREHFAKQLINTYLPQYWPNYRNTYEGVLVDNQKLNLEDSELHALLPRSSEGLIAKPDEFFTQRSLNNLVYYSTNNSKITDWIRKKFAKDIIILQGGKREVVKLENFLIEPFIPHKYEYYLKISTEENTTILKFKKVIGLSSNLTSEETSFEIKFVNPQPIEINKTELKERLEKFIDIKEQVEVFTEFLPALLSVYQILHFTLLEISPIAVVGRDVYLLDITAGLDYSQLFGTEAETEVASQGTDIPSPFGKHDKAETELQQQLISQVTEGPTITIVNPSGKIWLLVSEKECNSLYAAGLTEKSVSEQFANYSEFDDFTDETQMKDVLNILIQEIANYPNDLIYLVIEKKLDDNTSFDLMETLQEIIENNENMPKIEFVMYDPKSDSKKPDSSAHDVISLYKLLEEKLNN